MRRSCRLARSISSCAATWTPSEVHHGIRGRQALHYEVRDESVHLPASLVELALTRQQRRILLRSHTLSLPLAINVTRALVITLTRSLALPVEQTLQLLLLPPTAHHRILVPRLEDPTQPRPVIHERPATLRARPAGDGSAVAVADGEDCLYVARDAEAPPAAADVHHIWCIHVIVRLDLQDVGRFRPALACWR